MAVQIDQIGEDRAAAFWLASPHSSVFTQPEVLARLSPEVRWFAAFKGDEPLCAWPVCLDLDGRPALPPFAYYVGPLWSTTALARPNHRALSQPTDTYGQFIELFERLFGGIRAQLPIGLQDVRVFDWWNYNDVGRNRVRIAARYTALIDDLMDIEKTRAGYRELRRREVRKAERSGRFQVGSDATAAEILALYCETLSRRGGDIGETAGQTVRTIVDLATGGHGFVLAIRDDVGALAYAAVLLRARGRCNLVINAASASQRSLGVGAFGIDQSLARAIELGDDSFDFNGANSPQRGDDKHSYGARPELYFEIDYVA